jgi:hypothetical protein
MSITQPVNLATDLLLGGVVAWLAVLLFRAAARTRNPSVGLWAAGFASTALAAISGGIYHGLINSTAALSGLVLWKSTMLAVGLAGSLLLCGCLLGVTRSGARVCLLAAAGVKLVLYGVGLRRWNGFHYALADYAIDLVCILLLQAFAWWSRRATCSIWIGAGIAVAFAGALVQRSQVALHPYFDHNDLYHLIQVAAMWLLYRGGALLEHTAPWSPSLKVAAPPTGLGGNPVLQ